MGAAFGGMTGPVLHLILLHCFALHVIVGMLYSLRNDVALVLRTVHQSSSYYTYPYLKALSVIFLFLLWCISSSQ